MSDVNRFVGGWCQVKVLQPFYVKSVQELEMECFQFSNNVLDSLQSLSVGKSFSASILISFPGYLRTRPGNGNEALSFNIRVSFLYHTSL